MLTDLRISGLGVIDEASVELGPGFTAVTGETGAGKTMVVSGLGLLIGGKADARLIRNGASQARIEGRLRVDDDLADAVDAAGGVCEDDEVLIARVLTQGRSRALLGGAQVTLPALAEALGERITIHGQSEQVRLGSPERQLEVVDAFAGDAVNDLLERYRERWAQHKQWTQERDTLRRLAQERARELALLDFGLGEIAAVDPQPGEDADLQAEQRRLQAVDDLRMAAGGAVTALAGDDDRGDDAATVLGLLARARKSLAAAASEDAALASLQERLDEGTYLLADVAHDLASYATGLDADPLRLEWIAARLSDLQGLTRRYGDTIDDVLEWAAQAAESAVRLRSSDDRIVELETLIERVDGELRELAGRITAVRSEAAVRMAELARVELEALAMPHSRLVVDISPLGALGPHGADGVRILFSANPGSEPGPLARVASGGELSRVRLALEVVLAREADGHTYVFDEVDAGVGGAVALEIGRRLARLAGTAQVIVVTHLAQVAAFADRHIVVRKSDDGQVTSSGLQEVTGDERVDELARMMAGLDGTAAARAHAAELLAEAGRS